MTRLDVVRRARTWVHAALVAVVFGLPLFIGLGDTDLRNDESIYSYAAQSLLETGDWLNPRSSPRPDVVFVEKPPLKAWIVALPIRFGLLPNTEFGLRFWDPVFGAISFLYVFLIGRRLGGALCGWVAVMVLFTFEPLLFEHGLRENNMEAALLLAYCGGVWHFLAWSDAPSRRAGRRHIVAAGLFAFLGLMTKFVAVAFLPMVCGTAALLHRPTRRRLLDDRGPWSLCALGILALAAPWFLYQMTQPGEGVWTVMLGEHVIRRFSGSLDPTHLRPWFYYAGFVWDTLRAAGTAWLAAAGILLVAARAVGLRWLDGLLCVVWFVLPVTLISTGSSKLPHYVYPFVPPLALGAGYAVSAAVRWVQARLLAPIPVGLEPVVSRVVRRARATIDWIDGVAARFRRAADPRPARVALAACRALLLAVAVACGAMGLVALMRPGRIEVFGLLLQRHPSATGLLARAWLALLLAGYPRLAARAIPLLLVAVLLPFHACGALLPRLAVVDHPLRTTAACVEQVAERERQAGRPLRGLLLDLPDGFLHSQFFYLRRLGWEEHNPLPADLLRAALDVSARPGPVLIYRPGYRELWKPPLSDTVPLPAVLAIGDALLLLPGPTAACTPRPGR